MARFRNLLEEQDKFGFWKVLRQDGNDDSGAVMWLVECQGDHNDQIRPIRRVRGSELTRGTSTSCGCERRKRSKEKSSTHGLKGTKEYKTLAWAKARCHIPHAGGYVHYGGRGIVVDERWREDNGVLNFIEDIGYCPEPKDDYYLKRLDPDGDYTKDNCEWAKSDGKKRKIVT